MIKNYLLVAYRNLVRYKIYSIINITGLAIGIAFCILTFLYVHHEWSFDTFHKNANQMYRIYYQRTSDDGQHFDSSIRMPDPLRDQLINEFPEVQTAIRVGYGYDGPKDSEVMVQVGDTQFAEIPVFVDNDFFITFSFSLIHGDPNTVLQDPNGVVITSDMARKYFGSKNPIGQTLTFWPLMYTKNVQEFVVVGVAKNPPTNSSLQFDIVFPYDSIARVFWKTPPDWSNGRSEMFITLAPNAAPNTVESKLETIAKEHFASAKNSTLFALQPLQSLRSNIKIDSWTPTSDPTYAHILSSIAILVLTMASINFINITMGRATGRTREIGVRQIVGALKRQLLSQFWGEALVLCTLAMILGIALAELFLPTFNSLIDRSLNMDYQHLTFWLFLLILLFLIGSIAGGYPALVLSHAKPIEALKGKFALGNRHGFHRSLVTLQLILSVGLVICASTMFDQMAFLKNKHLGYRGEQVVMIPTLYVRESSNAISLLSEEFKKSSKVISTSILRYRNFAGLSVPVKFADKTTHAAHYIIDPNFLQTLDMTLLSGQDFSQTTSVNPKQAVIINETFARQLKDKNLIGKTIISNEQILTIIGIVEDFHLLSLHHQITPAMLVLNQRQGTRLLMVRIHPNNISETLTFMQTTWKKINPELPFEFYFLDSFMDQQYREDKKWSQIISYATLFTIFIACLGAFGLTALAVSRRTKEIGIRKVLGATVPNIINLLSREFVLLIALANIIAWPVAYWAMTQWLANFAYRINLGIGTFILGGLLTLIVVIATVSTQAFKAAKMNPVDTLRYE